MELQVMKKIRTRFAPSPTGYVHVGSVRTALYCYLFARHHGGDYVLRIEDTDRTRLVDDAVSNLLQMMKVLGIQHDEGPDAGGDYGPYVQSERLHIYRKYADELLEKGLAYRCFCSSERLDQMRSEQEARGVDPGYDRKCRDMDSSELELRMKAGESFVVRMKVPFDGNVMLDDAVRGRVEFSCSAIEDQVLMKSDGFPTYHFANIVDDHLMEISHVIRGEEWLPSTPKHLLLYSFFGWEPPLYAHLPLLLSQDRKKLSKRSGDVAVEDFLSAGYLPEVLINFLALLGWHAPGDREIFSLSELVSEFSLDRISKSGAVFDREKLSWMNTQYLKTIISNEYWLHLAKEKLSPDEKSLFSAEDVLDEALLALRPSLEDFSGLGQSLALFTREPQEWDLQGTEVAELLALPTNARLFDALMDGLVSSNFDESGFRGFMKTLQKEQQIKGKAFFMPLRIAFSGEMHGPDLFAYYRVLGAERLLERVRFIRNNLP
jgi:nondiscriminating glutamyl-tRNA synthetase